MIWPLIYFYKVLNYGAKNGKGVALFTAFLLWINNIIDTCVNAIVIVVKGLFDTLNITAFQNVTLGSIPGIEYINAVFPVAEFVALGTIFVTAWVLLIVIRWTKSFIPTVAN